MAHSGKNLSRREMIKMIGVGLAGTALASCGAAPTPTPVVIEKTVEKIVEKPVTQVVEKQVTQVVEKVVEKQVTQVVEKVVTASVPTVAKLQRIKFWNWLDNPSHPAFPTLLKRFEEKNSNIRVDWELGAYATMHDKLVSSFAAGVGPDAFQIGAEWIGELEGMKAIQALDTWYNDWPGRHDIYTRVINQYKYIKGTPGGIGPLYGLPFLLVAQYLYFRRDWVKEVGFKGTGTDGGPGTMDEFVQLGLAVTDPKKPRYGYAMRGGQGGTGMWMNAAGSMGLKIWDWIKQGETWKFTLDTEKSIKAHAWYVELYTKHKICPPSAPTDSFAEIVGNMKSGLCCMTFHHVQTIQVIGDAVGMDNLGVTPVPKGPNAADWTSYGGAGCNCINTKSTVKDGAFAWISYIASAEWQGYWAKTYGGVPVNPSLSTDPELTANRFVKATMDSAPSWDVLPTTPGMGEFGTTRWPTAMQQCLGGKLAPEAMCKDLNAFLEKTKG